MTALRDPRVDPRPGDVIRMPVGGVWTLVPNIAFSLGEITWVGPKGSNQCGLPQWQRTLAEKGDIVHVAGSDDHYGVTQIMSGGQTGGDQGALYAGSQLGITTGGYAPKGWRTQAGPAPWLANFGLVECNDSDYPTRTRLNARDSEGTVFFGDIESPGGQCTMRACGIAGKPILVLSRTDIVSEFDRLPALRRFRVWIAEHRITTLNGAGNREESQPGLGAETCDFLCTALGDLS